MKDSNVSIPAASTGFELAQNPENGFYHFYCKDINGKIILWSKDFQSQSEAQKKLSEALRFAKQERHYLHKAEAGAHYFVLTTGNKQQELARSIAFDDEKAMQLAMRYMRQVANSDKAMARTPESPEAEPTGKEMRTRAGKIADKPQSTRFKIELLWREDEQCYSGRITDALHEAHATFQDIDGAAIVSFIRSRLSPVNSRTIEAPTAAEHAELQLLLEENGQPVRSVASGQPLLFLVLRLQPSDWDTTKPIAIYLSIRNLGGAILSNMESRVILRADYTAPISLPGHGFSTGMYRVTLTGSGQTQAGQKKIIEGACVFQIF